MMKFFVVFASLVLVINAASDKELWLKFKQDHGKEYRNLREEQVRFSIFQDNLRTIEAHNELYDKGEKTYYLGVTKFTDLTPQEFKSMLNYSAQAKPVGQQPPVWHVPTGLQAPSSINWVNRGVVTEVKDQGNCGSCWSFSTTGAVEGAYAQKHGNLVSLSEQNLIDCSTVNGGCDGGWMQAGYEYIRDNGIETEADYPYEARDANCRFTRSKSVTTVTSYVSIPQSESALVDAVGNVGPIAIAINAAHFQNFAGGVFVEPACDGVDLNHGVLAVGYGKQDGLDYWLVKNSWGAQWGENGYVKMARNHNNQCGIANDASYPNV